MTPIEMIVWGKKEDELRKQDLETVNSPEDLKRIQLAAKKRRNKVGLSSGQAFKVVLAAQKAVKQNWTDEQAAQFGL